MNGRPIRRDFFRRDPVTCARELIGCVVSLGGCSGKIVETEAYAAEGDPACHTTKRRAARDFVTDHPPGTTYVYLNYGMHWLLNFLVKEGSSDGFVLIRALEPIWGTCLMATRRGRDCVRELCNGPAKLTQALAITGAHHGADPLARGGSWNLFLPSASFPVADATRIGISQATERKWRFLLEGSPYASLPA